MTIKSSIARHPQWVHPMVKADSAHYQSTAVRAGVPTIAGRKRVAPDLVKLPTALRRRTRVQQEAPSSVCTSIPAPASEVVAQTFPIKSNFALPFEIREQIYGHSCHKKTYQITCRDTWRRISSSPPYSPLQDVSRQIRHEFLRFSEERSTWIFEIDESTWSQIWNEVKRISGRSVHPGKIVFIWDGFVFNIKVLLRITIDLTSGCIGDRVNLIDTWEPSTSQSQNDELDEYMEKIYADVEGIAGDLYSKREVGELAGEDILDAVNQIFLEGWEGKQPSMVPSMAG